MLVTLALASLVASASAAIALCRFWGSRTSFTLRNRCGSKEHKSSFYIYIDPFGIITSTRSMSMPQGSVAVSIIVWKQILQLISRLRSWSGTGSDQSYLESTSNGLPLWQQLGERLRPQNVPGQRWFWIPKKFSSLTWEWLRRAAWSTLYSRRRCRPQPSGS